MSIRTTIKLSGTISFRDRWIDMGFLPSLFHEWYRRILVHTSREVCWNGLCSYLLSGSRPTSPAICPSSFWNRPHGSRGSQPAELGQQFLDGSSLSNSLACGFFLRSLFLRTLQHLGRLLLGHDHDTDFIGQDDVPRGDQDRGALYGHIDFDRLEAL